MLKQPSQFYDYTILRGLRFQDFGEI